MYSLYSILYIARRSGLPVLAVGKSANILRNLGAPAAPSLSVQNSRSISHVTPEVSGALCTQSHELTVTGWMSAIAIGLISCALLMANNVRDIPTDRESGKLTLAVRLGDWRARIAYCAEMLIALLLGAFVVPHNPWFLVTFILLGPTVHSCVTVLFKQGPALIPVLKQAGIVALIYSILVAISVWLHGLNLLSNTVEVFTGY